MTARRGDRLGLSALLIGIVALVLAWTSPAAADRRVALVLGNSAYKSIVALTNPRNDAEDVATALRDLGFEVMIRTDVQRADVRDVLKDFSRMLSGADTALVYYAGHALQYQGRYYLVPVDSGLEDEDAIRFDMLAADEVRSVLSKVTGVRIMVFDACRNDPFADKPLPNATPVPQGQTRGLTRVSKPQGTVIAFATAAFDVAEDGKARNSPFTRAFLKWLKEPGLEIGQMFRLVTRDVFEATGGRQTPEITVSLLDDYYLNRTESDQTFWSRIRFSDDPADFRDFLSRFPKSPFVGDARFRLAALETASKRIEEARRADEERRRREDEAKAREAHERQCADAASRVATLAGNGDRGSLESLKAQGDCPEAAHRAEEALAALAAAAVAEKARLAAEAAEKARVEACGREAEQIDAAIGASKRGDLQALSTKACAENRDRIAAGLVEIGRREAAAAEKARVEACGREAAQIDAAIGAGRKADLQALAAKACPENRDRIGAGLDRIARAEAEAAEKARLEACAREGNQIDSAITGLKRSDLQALSTKACAENRDRIAAGLVEIGRREAAAAEKARVEACTREAAQMDAAAGAGKKSDLQGLSAKACPENRDRIAAALDTLARQEADAAAKARAETCRREAAQIDTAANAGKKGDLQALAARLACPENGGLVETALADIGRREAAAAEKARVEACNREAGQIDGAVAAGRKSDLQALSAKACAENRDRIAAGLAQIGEREAAAAEKARLEACNREAGLIDVAAAAGKTSDLDALGARVCVENRDRLSAAIASVAAREADATAKARAESCAREASRIAAAASAGRKDELQAISSRLACAEDGGLVATALAAIAEREAAVAAEKVCADEGREVERLKRLGAGGRKQLGEFSASMKCETLKSVVVAVLEEPVPTLDPKERLDRMHVALDRVGCWPQETRGSLEDATRDAVGEWLKARKERVETASIRLDDDLLGRLEGEPSKRVCPLQCGADEVERGGRCVAKPEDKRKSKPAEARDRTRTNEQRQPARQEPRQETRPATRSEPPAAAKPTVKPTIMLGL